MKMTGGQALVRSLHREGVRIVFGLPGVQTYHAVDAFYDYPDIQFVTTRHEQATTYMADGYARTSGKVGVALVVPGPGLLNASAGLGTAYATSSPVLLISGQVNRDKLGKNIGVLHEINDQLDVVKPITKWSSRVLDARHIPETIDAAFSRMYSGRPRPIEIEIPPDALEEYKDIDLYEPGFRDRATLIDLAELDQAIKLIDGAENPVILAGGGVNASEGAPAVLLALSEFLQAPVISTSEGKGSISDRNSLSLGVPRRSGDAVMEFVKTCDLVVAVGTRLADFNLEPNQHVVHVDIDKEEFGRNHSNSTGVLGDARVVLEKLLDGIASISSPRPSREYLFEKLRKERWGLMGSIQPQGEFVNAIRDSMPDDGILVAGMTQVGYYSRWFYPTYAPRTYLTSSYFGNLGFAYPTALGAKLACPDKAVVTISGDGGFLFNSQELATAVMYGINVVAIVFNDNAYGNVLRDQRRRFNGRVVGSRLHNPDFVRLAEAYGARGVRVTTPGQLSSELKGSLAIERPTVIEVPVGEMPAPF